VLVSSVSYDDTRIYIISNKTLEKPRHESKPGASTNRFLLTLEATGILEFALAAVDLPVVVACAALFTGMLVLPATGIDDRGFPNIFQHF